MRTENHTLGTIYDGAGHATVAHATSIPNGRELLSVVDDFVASQSQFDRQARVGIPLDALKVTQEIYLAHVRAQVMQWSDSEVAALKDIVASLRQKFAQMTLHLPSDIYIVKTTGIEEGYAAYTRAHDTIALPSNMVASLASSENFGDPLHAGPSQTYLEKIVNHEMFHIISKNNPGLRHTLYGQVNYHATGNEIVLPDVPFLLGRTLPEMKITNPDAPRLDVYIEMDVEIDGVVRKTPLVPILLSDEKYVGGTFFGALDWKFMAIEGEEGAFRPMLRNDGTPWLFDSKPLMGQYMSLVGRNITGEIFHPDEILAQSFVLISEQPSMGLLQTLESEIRAGG